MTIAAIILIVMVGFRREVGGDWWNYLHIYNSVADGSLSYSLRRAEPGYGLLNWLAAQAGWGIWFPNFICAVIFTWGLISFSRLQPNPSLAIVVSLAYFVIVVAMGYTRQSAALGFVMLAIAQLYRGQMSRMVLSLVLATTFHTSAMVMAPILALGITNRGFVTIVVFMVLTAALLFQSFRVLTELLTVYTAETLTAGGALPRLAMNFIPALVFLSIPRRLTSGSVERRLWTVFALVVLLSVFMVFFVSSSVVVDRLGLYLIPLQILVWSRLPVALGFHSQQNMMILSAIIVYSLAATLVWFNYTSYAHHWLPYKNYLWDSGAGKIPPRWYRRAT